MAPPAELGLALAPPSCCPPPSPVPRRPRPSSCCLWRPPLACRKDELAGGHPGPGHGWGRVWPGAAQPRGSLSPLLPGLPETWLSGSVAGRTHAVPPQEPSEGPPFHTGPAEASGLHRERPGRGAEALQAQSPPRTAQPPHLMGCSCSAAPQGTGGRAGRAEHGWGAGGSAPSCSSAPGARSGSDAHRAAATVKSQAKRRREAGPWRVQTTRAGDPLGRCLLALPRHPARLATSASGATRAALSHGSRECPPPRRNLQLLLRPDGLAVADSTALRAVTTWVSHVSGVSCQTGPQRPVSAAARGQAGEGRSPHPRSVLWG